MNQNTINVIRKDIEFILKEYQNNNFTHESKIKLEQIDSLLLLEELKNEDNNTPKGFIRVHPKCSNEPMLISIDQIKSFSDGVINIKGREYSVFIKEGYIRIIEMLNKC